RYSKGLRLFGNTAGNVSGFLITGVASAIKQRTLTLNCFLFWFRRICAAPDLRLSTKCFTCMYYASASGGRDGEILGKRDRGGGGGHCAPRGCGHHRPQESDRWCTRCAQPGCRGGDRGLCRRAEACQRRLREPSHGAGYSCTGGGKICRHRCRLPQDRLATRTPNASLHPRSCPTCGESETHRCPVCRQGARLCPASGPGRKRLPRGDAGYRRKGQWWAAPAFVA